MGKFKWSSLIPGFIAGVILTLVEDATSASFMTIFGAYAIGCVTVIATLVIQGD